MRGRDVTLPVVEFNRRAARLAISVALLLAAGGAWAGSHAIAVGAIDPASLSDSTASVDIPYRCTGGAAQTLAWSVSSNDGMYRSAPNTPRLRHIADPTRYLPYSLNVPA